MNNTLKEILSTTLYLLSAVLLAFIVIKFVAQRSDVTGDSMNPTLHDKDVLILNKIGYHLGEPERFDIVVFPFRNGSNKNYIKRIIALPGETIQIDFDGNIYIDGEILEEHYGKEVILKPGNAAEPITLGEDQYFVMGDNRNDSSDSRFDQVGIVYRDEILGKAWVRVWPFKDFGRVDK